MILFGTGHRPEDCEPEATVRKKVRNALEELQPTVCITGMAAGFDLWFGLEALEYGALLWTYRPWAGHKPRKGDESVYAHLLENASKRVDVNVTAAYLGPWLYLNRNHLMVDHSDHGLAYSNGKSTGGTAECLSYAKSNNKEVTNCYDY